MSTMVVMYHTIKYIGKNNVTLISTKISSCYSTFYGYSLYVYLKRKNVNEYINESDRERGEEGVRVI